MRHRSVYIPIFFASCLALLSGCLARRGIDFGHWAGRGESIHTIRVFDTGSRSGSAEDETVLLLPVAGKISGDGRDKIEASLYREMKNYFPVRILCADHNGIDANYLGEDNLVSPGGRFDAVEVGRIGRLLGATHVLCVNIREWKQYPPQVLSLSLAMIASESGRPVVKMDATFDASEQQVVVALADHLQRREARKYSGQSLDVLLRSPTEYGAFVSAQCMRALAETLWSRDGLKKTGRMADEVQ